MNLFRRGIWGRITDVVERLLFTTGLFAAVIAFAFWSDSHNAQLSDTWRNTLGFSTLSIVDLDWHQSLTSLVLTAGEEKFLQSIVMLCLSVGMCEWLLGTRTASKLFFASHLTVTVGLAVCVILPWHLAGAEWATALAIEKDVGPSAGYYGCLGAVVSICRSGVRPWLIAAISTVLFGRLVLSVPSLHLHPATVSADLSHMAAFLFGVLTTNFGFWRAGQQLQ